MVFIKIQGLQARRCAECPVRTARERRSLGDTGSGLHLCGSTSRAIPSGWRIPARNFSTSSRPVCRQPTETRAAFEAQSRLRSRNSAMRSGTTKAGLRIFNRNREGGSLPLSRVIASHAVEGLPSRCGRNCALRRRHNFPASALPTRLAARSMRSALRRLRVVCPGFLYQLKS